MRISSNLRTIHVKITAMIVNANSVHLSHFLKERSRSVIKQSQPNASFITLISDAFIRLVHAWLLILTRVMIIVVNPTIWIVCKSELIQIRCEMWQNASSFHTADLVGNLMYPCCTESFAEALASCNHIYSYVRRPICSSSRGIMVPFDILEKVCDESSKCFARYWNILCCMNSFVVLIMLPMQFSSAGAITPITEPRTSHQMSEESVVDLKPLWLQKARGRRIAKGPWPKNAKGPWPKED